MIRLLFLANYYVSSDWDISLFLPATENLLSELESRDEANEKLSAELEGSKDDVDRMVEELKNKEREHAGETAELVNKNSELTEMLDDTMEKLDTTQKELEEQAERLSESEVLPIVISIHLYTPLIVSETYKRTRKSAIVTENYHTFALAYSSMHFLIHAEIRLKLTVGCSGEYISCLLT